MCVIFCVVYSGWSVCIGRLIRLLSLVRRYRVLRFYYTKTNKRREKRREAKSAEEKDRETHVKTNRYAYTHEVVIACCSCLCVYK